MSYLIFDTLDAAKARSTEQCRAVGDLYDDYWWGVVIGPSGKGAVWIMDNDPFYGATTANNYTGGVQTGLSPAEQALLVPSTDASLAGWNLWNFA